MVIWFILEFVVRIWSAGCRSCYQDFAGRIQFLRNPFCIIGESFVAPEVETPRRSTTGSELERRLVAANLARNVN